MPRGDGTGPPGRGRGRRMGRGTNMGRGGARGMGRGGGRGIGRGGGRGIPPAMAQGQGTASAGARRANTANAEDELLALRQQAEVMGRQLEQIHERIRSLQRQEDAAPMAARVDPDKCTGCGICVDVCPVEAISVDNHLAVVDRQTCTACGLCVNECPNEAISVG